MAEPSHGHIEAVPQFRADFGVDGDSFFAVVQGRYRSGDQKCIGIANKIIGERLFGFKIDFMLRSGTVLPDECGCDFGTGTSVLLSEILDPHC
jgi:hypothetical protein